MEGEIPLHDSTARGAPFASRLAIGTAAAAVLLLAALHVTSPEFNPAWRVVSEYANGSYGWLLSLMFAAWALSSWALAFALRSHAASRSIRVGLVLLAIAGAGEAMAAVFDINHDALHAVAEVLAVPSLPVAAMLISVAVSRHSPPPAARTALLVLAHLTWVSVVLVAGTLVVLTVTFSQVAGGLPSKPPAVLPPGVVGLVGWANRLLVVVDCAWVIVVAAMTRRKTY